ncbi:MAG: aspartate-semialdehyde dehydrogenase [Verrucomicrobia bacterium]|nr:aspartate-semialdehyde dehydrogenase [Verrucomicrobiota bacterium]MCH8528715.1 aspartate-semialdehyde dehydrogenase [Kiritimatiellia bacterium]
MQSVGFIGWRGMVGSVLIDRMRRENDFQGFEPVFFTTSQAGQAGPDVGGGASPLRDANDVRALAEMDILVSCQGGDYTKEMHPKLRAAGWRGYWIDAASALRMKEDAVIVLDPVNRKQIEQALNKGLRDFVGGNCTVSLMLMGMQGLFDAGLVEWVSSMTYQSASGAGAKNMKELVAQMGGLADAGRALAEDPASQVLELDRIISAKLNDGSLPTDAFGAPLAANLIPWIDSAMEDGRTREEWKGMVETNKILGTATPIPVDGQCVRVGAMRCHSQALTVKLTRDVPLAEVEALIAGANDWVKLVPNEKAATLAGLTPAAVSGGLDIPVGRLRKMALGGEYLTAFTVGDQLLWGAAEPVRRMLLIVLGRL